MTKYILKQVKPDMASHGGKLSTLEGGEKATIIGGNGTPLIGGDGSTLSGGKLSTFTGGDGAVLIGEYIDSNGNSSVAVAVVGEKGIKAGVAYTVDRDGEFVEA